MVGIYLALVVCFELCCSSKHWRWYIQKREETKSLATNSNRIKDDKIESNS